MQDNRESHWTYRFLGILEESLCTIRNAQFLLCQRSGSIDTGRSLGGVATHKPAHEGLSGQFKTSGVGHAPLLVEHQHISTPLKKSVCSRETSETTTDYDDLRHSC